MKVIVEVSLIAEDSRHATMEMEQEVAEVVVELARRLNEDGPDYAPEMLVTSRPAQ